MTYEVIFTDKAHEHLEAIYLWWLTNRSAEQAARWYGRVAAAVRNLALSPDRYPLSRENTDFPYEIRDLYIGSSGRPTHRAIFTIVEDRVIVVAIRHLAQREITPDEV